MIKDFNPVKILPFPVKTAKSKSNDNVVRDMVRKKKRRSQEER